ncbi:Non-green plastid inner envelope membrane protein [Rhynchospora pubera]|uniref:Non-green plastid inner envelope membrane protein n=1 Tax=Rhynchospora pubera TaxID=906938 RepID=A0AAV8EPI4_9POAL|nr:Non-green plastid inner envelope membrane protein [Rhynchospora pubera]
MALALQRSFVSLKTPNYISKSHLRPISAPVCLRRFNLTQLQPATCLRSIHVDSRGFSRLISFATSHEDSQPVPDSEKKNGSDIKVENSEEAWKESLEYFKTEAIKLKAMSEEAYDIYSKQASEVLLTLSEKLKIEAAKAQNDLSKIAKEISEEGQEYLTRVSENPPESTKELVGVLKESSEVKNIDDVQDYHVGVVYGSYLAILGFLTFMIYGSIVAVRFGIILGSGLVALAIWSKRSYNSGRKSRLLFKGQTAIAIVIFFRALTVFRQGGTLLNFVHMLISAAAAGFYVYRMLTRGDQSKGPTSQPSSED